MNGKSKGATRAMMRASVLHFAAVVAIQAVAMSPAAARPGGYLSLGLGRSGVAGETLGQGRFGADSDGTRLVIGGPSTEPTTEMDGGKTAMLRLGFNILGYAAVEAAISGQGTNLMDGAIRSWAAHTHIGPRLYPLWHWQARLPPLLQPLEPSLYAGWGASWQAYKPQPRADELGWSRVGTWRYGAGLEYFVVTYFKVMLDYSYVRASYDNFIYNFDDSINFPVSPAARTSYHQVYLSVALHFSPSGEMVRYPSPDVEPAIGTVRTPAATSDSDALPAPTPAPSPVPPVEQDPPASDMVDL